MIVSGALEMAGAEVWRHRLRGSQPYRQTSVAAFVRSEVNVRSTVDVRSPVFAVDAEEA